MTRRKATFSVTTDATGFGSDDARVQPTRDRRPAVLRAVEMTASAGNPKVTIYEAPYDDVELVYDYGTQLFYSTSLGSDGVVHPRVATVDELGVAISGEESGDIYIDERYIRCDIEDGSPSSDYTVVVTYETAGDYRF